VPADDTGQAAALAKRVDQLKDHPAMLVWEAPDEPLWTHWWSRYGDIWKQHAEMDVIIVGAGETLKPQLQALKDSSEARHGRGLFAEADDLREEFWKLVGKPVPGPDRRFSSAVRRAAEQGDALTRGFALVKKIDPEGIRWINHAPRNSVQSLRHFNREVDMAGCDIYPVPVYQSGHSDLVNQSLSSVGAYTRRMADGAPGKSVAMVLQGFAWKDINQIKKDDHRPTFAETRFMAYDAILHGAAAIMWYGTAHIPKDSDLWRDILRTARELRRLEPALVAPPWPDPPRCIADEIPDSHDGPGPALLLRKVEDDFVILAVNETRYGLSFHVSKLPRALEGRVLHRLGTDETHTVSEGSFSDGIAAFDVHVYSTSRRFE